MEIVISKGLLSRTFVFFVLDKARGFYSLEWCNTYFVSLRFGLWEFHFPVIVASRRKLAELVCIIRLITWVKINSIEFHNEIVE